MSATTLIGFDEPVQIAKVLEPRINIDKNKRYEFMSGVQSIVFKQITASSASNNSVTFSYKPSQNVLLSRRMYVQYTLNLQFSGSVVGPGDLLKIGTDDALRAFPLQTCASSVKLRLNGTEISLDQPDQCLQGLLRYSSAWDQSQDFSTCPSYVDQYQQYTDYTTLGSNRNVLASFGENALYQTRGSLDYQIVSNTPTAAEVNITVVEPLLLPTLIFGQGKTSDAFASVQDLNLSFNLDGLTRVWSHSTAGGSTITSITPNIASSQAAYPKLLFDELTPSPDVATVEMGKQYLYPYKLPQVYVFDNLFSGVTSGSTVSNSINSIQFGQIPSAVYVFVKERLADQQSTSGPNYRAWTATDTFAAIENVSISINGQASIMAEASQQQLYQICNKNGLKDCFVAFQKHVGSSLLLQFGSDLPLQNGAAPGMISNFNFQLNNIRIKNTSAATKNYQVCVVPIFDGVLAIRDSQAILQTGLINNQQAIQAPVVNASPEMAMYGSSFFGDLLSGIKSGVSGVVKGVRENLPIIKTVTGIAKPFLPAPIQTGLSAVGLGRKKKRLGMKMKKGKGLSGDMYGSGITYKNAGRVGIEDNDELNDRMEEFEISDEEE